MKLIYMDATIRYMIKEGYDCRELIASGVTKMTSDKEPYLIVDIL